MKKKKVLTKAIASLAAVCLCAGFSACGKTNNESNRGETGEAGKSAYEIWLSQGHTGTEQDFLEWLKADNETTPPLDFYPLDDGTYAVSAGNASLLSKIEIPATYKGKLVTKINKSGFANCHNLTSIIIPDSVTSIGDYAFSGCSELTSITIPNGVTSIGNFAFNECSGLTSITIPDSVTSISDSAFIGCSKLTYNVKENLKYLGNPENSYFYLANTTNTNITEAKIDTNCRLIGASAFSGCSELTSITIPDSVTSIGDDAFYGCSKLTSITIPNNVTSFGNYAFRDCSSLTSITIPNSVTSFGDCAFWGCSSLTNITVPNSVTSFGNYAFRDCSSLTSITIPNSVTSFGDCAFWGCSSLTNITVPNSVTSFGNYAFRDCSRLQKIYYKGDGNEWEKIKIFNSYLIRVTLYYFSETQPTTSGNFWHYNSNNEIEEW